MNDEENEPFECLSDENNDENEIESYNHESESDDEGRKQYSEQYISKNLNYKRKFYQTLDGTQSSLDCLSLNKN